MRLFMYLFLAGVLLSACQSQKTENQLAGTWTSTRVLENEVALPLNPGIIQFAFTTDGHYDYQSTLNYKESGNYYVEGMILYATDTTHEASFQRTVKLEHLSADSLVIQMQEEGRNRQIFLKAMAQ